VSRFVTTLRTQPTAIRLGGADAESAWTLRVQCAEAWDAVRVELTHATRVIEVKRAAMSVLMPDVDDIGEYVVKLNGFEITDERQSVESVGAVDGSTLLVMSRRRRAVR
jgi:hypothetical protein